MTASPPSDVFLRKGHIQPVWAGHPWVFQQAIERSSKKPEHGAEVRVLDVQGHFLGRGFFSENSALAIRLFSREDEPFSSELLRTRLERASARRAPFLEPTTTGYRVIHGEGDELPGLVVDRFDDVLVVQFGSAGLARHRSLVLDALEGHFRPRTILDRTTEKVSRQERFERESGLIRGETPGRLTFDERGLRFELPLELTQKTGFYFDQRPLRARVEALARDREVLDLYSYVGGAGLFAARGGASRVVSVDSSTIAVETGASLARTLGLSVDFERSDALEFLERHPTAFDLVLSDPPKLAQSRSGRDKALAYFRKVTEASLRAVRPGGLLAVSSCSAALGLREVERALALAARDAARRATVLERIFQGPDHPVPPAFPEGLYLTTLLAEIV